MNRLTVLALLSQCAPDIPPQNLMTIIDVESAFNQFAVAVVQKQGDSDFIKYSQPETLEQAVSLVDLLESKNKNYSVGLMQINRVNFAQYSINKNNMFDACKNIKTGGDIYKNCYELAKKKSNNVISEQELLRMANSCYYSGNVNVKRADNNVYVDKINKSIKGVSSVYSVPTLTADSQSAQNSISERTAPEWDVFNDFSK